MGEKRAYKPRKPGGGRKKLKPEYDARKNLKEQMERAVALYDYEMSLQAIGEELGLNPIKVRKLLITAGVYESDVAEKVQDTFEECRETQDYKTSILSTANTLQLSKASVTSYLPYKKGVYYPGTEKEKISVGAERQRRYRAMKRWKTDPTEENLLGSGSGLCWCEIQNLTPGCHLLTKLKRAEMASTRRSCGLTDGRRVKFGMEFGAAGTTEY